MKWMKPAVVWALLTAAGMAGVKEVGFTTSPAFNIGVEKGVMRRDPSDILKENGRYYVWYTKGDKFAGYDATIWYATSLDGHTWTEQGEAIARGAEGSWDEQSVFTPNILKAEGKFWLFYTAVPKPFLREETKTAIGVMVSDSPDGPWVRCGSNPVLKASENPELFDSFRVDDSCLVVRDGKYWMYYKGRQWGKTSAQTKMGVAIADKPGGPYVKHKANPLIQGGHEVIVWPYGSGIVALIGHRGSKAVRETLQYAGDGISFKKLSSLEGIPWAGGTYRPEAFTDSNQGRMIEWGLQIARKEGELPFLERFDYRWAECAPEE
ncbi:family 43 glycosylhydrolase [Pontiella agarivorans]|uniref:Family 43 glycosylhydrolase n=1 Tax=Pontiella agarivorans TaxID=3038953 RepID=A0ABU5MSG7_9BACT|nr:family 43 glycosylhydrolase [Pontiella agarivorans]MDZ8117031.1 family 43 glycosylhydrolase [Pontiella agarivorans]